MRHHAAIGYSRCVNPSRVNRELSLEFLDEIPDELDVIDVLFSCKPTAVARIPGMPNTVRIGHDKSFSVGFFGEAARLGYVLSVSASPMKSNDQRGRPPLIVCSRYMDLVRSAIQVALACTTSSC